MRRRRAWVSHQAVELNVIPLIDVVFFLLVFYVISTSFTPETAVAVARPQSSQATTSDVPSVQVVVTAGGTLVLAGHQLTTAELPAAVAAELARSGASRVVVVADRQVPTGDLLAIMDGCTAGGAKAVDVAAFAGSSP
jgi:biopolymer transport protein ExbD